MIVYVSSAKWAKHWQRSLTHPKNIFRSTQSQMCSNPCLTMLGHLQGGSGTSPTDLQALHFYTESFQSSLLFG